MSRFVSDIAIFVLKRDVKLQPTNQHVEIARTCSKLVAERFETGRGPVADLLARASSLPAS